ncbi:LysR family transcriptional regulator [Streptomyces sp. SCL15-4]|uniref:LysR family transcriptional regulator n=1 Tax=Streptomyces sp. SCL15-4 TaxID=2967221 RepID=UPI0029675233|nr:LysR family transcriptional regulator [Streptomyces sp. SCL15-4]
MDHNELACFLVLAEELHFGRTADRLRLSRARVSQLVQRLERRVGAPLFTRTSRRVALTDLGSGLRAELEPHYRGIQDALAHAVAAARAATAVLHVGFSTPLAGEIALKTAERLRAARPGLTVEVCEVPFGDPYGLLRRGDFDVQLTDFPARDTDLRQGPVLLTEGRVLAVAAGHPLAGRDAVTPEDLAGVALLDVEGDVPEHWRRHRTPDRTPGGRPIGRGPSVTSFQEALTLVAGGRGALLTAAHTAVYHGRPGVSYVPVVGEEPLRYGVMWRAGDTNGTVRLFAALAHEAARHTPPPSPSAHRVHAA